MLLLLAPAGLAPTDKKPEPKKVRRLESINWGFMSHTLSWTVKHCAKVNGEFFAIAVECDEITPDAAAMKVADEKPRFELH